MKFADLEIDTLFYAHTLGTRNVECIKTSATHFKALGTRNRWVENIRAGTDDDVYLEPQVFVPSPVIPVPGHSSTYPYGEH